MNVILESLNETQSQIDQRSPQVIKEHQKQQDGRMLDMHHLNDSQFIGYQVLPRNYSKTPPVFGGGTPKVNMTPGLPPDEEERRKV